MASFLEVEIFMCVDNLSVFVRHSSEVPGSRHSMEVHGYLSLSLSFSLSFFLSFFLVSSFVIFSFFQYCVFL